VTVVELRDDKVKEIMEKMWNFHDRELSNRGYTHQEIMVAWDSVSIAELIKASKTIPENAKFLKALRELIDYE